MLKAKSDYHTACKNERSAINQERNASGDTSLSPDQVKKLQERVVKCKEDVLKFREKYDTSLRELSDYNPKYQEEMSDVFEKCQDFEEKRLHFFKQTLLEIHSCLDISSDPSLAQVYKEMKQVLDSADSAKDLKWWSSNHGVGMPTNFPVFEEYTPDLHNISKKERKIVSQIVHQDSVTLTHVNHNINSSSGLPRFDSNGQTQTPSNNTTSGYSSSVANPTNHGHYPASASHPHHHGHHSSSASTSSSTTDASSTFHGPTTTPKNNGVHSSVPLNGTNSHHHNNGHVKTVSINESSNKRYSSQHHHAVSVTVENNKMHRPHRGSTSSHENNPFDQDDNNPFNNEDNEDWDDYPKDALIDTGEPGVPVRALYDYEGAESDELSFKLGDEFEKLEDEDEQGWCKGRKDGRVGLYPANYVEPIPLPLPVK